MTDLKTGWKRVKFGEVVRLNKETCKDLEAAGINRVIGLEHLEPGDLRVRSWADVADGTTFSNRVRPGQVLFGKRRAYQRKVAVADFDAICSGDIYVFETADQTQLLQELLPYICQTDSFFEYAVGTSAGSLSPRTNWKSLEAYQFALPPMEEQRRILRLLSATTRAVNALDDAATKSRTALFTVVDDAIARHSCEQLPLEKMLDPTRSFSYGILKPGEPVEAGVPMFRLIDFDDLGRRVGSVVLRVSKEVAATKLSTTLRQNDLLVSVVGTIGRTFLVSPEMDGWNVNRQLAVVALRDPRLAEWVQCVMLSAHGRSWFRARILGSAQPLLNLADLRTFPVPILSEVARSEVVYPGAHCATRSRRSTTVAHACNENFLVSSRQAGTER